MSMSMESPFLERTVGSIVNGGMAYSIPIHDQGTDIASTYLALGSQQNDAYWGTFVYENVVNRLIAFAPMQKTTG